jgi:hypothetical protein
VVFFFLRKISPIGLFLHVFIEGFFKKGNIFKLIYLKHFSENYYVKVLIKDLKGFLKVIQNAKKAASFIKSDWNITFYMDNGFVYWIFMKIPL